MKAETKIYPYIGSHVVGCCFAKLYGQANAFHNAREYDDNITELESAANFGPTYGCISLDLRINESGSRTLLQTV